MAEMKEDSMCVRGIRVPMGHERINKDFQIKDPKNGSKYKKMLKVWFYFITSVIIPTKHLSTISEQETFILYAILKGYKFDVGKIIESSIRCFHKNVKRGLIPH